MFQLAVDVGRRVRNAITGLGNSFKKGTPAEDKPLSIDRADRPRVGVIHHSTSRPPMPSTRTGGKITLTSKHVAKPGQSRAWPVRDALVIGCLRSSQPPPPLVQHLQTRSKSPNVESTSPAAAAETSTAFSNTSVEGDTSVESRQAESKSVQQDDRVYCKFEFSTLPPAFTSKYDPSIEALHALPTPQKLSNTSLSHPESAAKKQLNVERERSTESQASDFNVCSSASSTPPPYFQFGSENNANHFNDDSMDLSADDNGRLNFMSVGTCDDFGSPSKDSPLSSASSGPESIFDTPQPSFEIRSQSTLSSASQTSESSTQSTDSLSENKKKHILSAPKLVKVQRELQERLNQSEKQIEILEKEKFGALQELAALEQDLNRHEQVNGDLHDENVELIEENRELQHHLSIAVSRANEAGAQNYMLMEEIEFLKSQNEELIYALDRKDEAIAYSDGMIRDGMTLVDDMRERIGYLERLNATLRRVEQQQPMQWLQLAEAGGSTQSREILN